MIRVYLPVPGTFAAQVIKPGAGIVGRPVNDAVEIDFEGRIYGQAGMARFVERVMHAHGRQAERYPTVSRMLVPAHTLDPVGWYEPDAPAAGLVIADDAAATARLCEWLGVTEDALDVELGWASSEKGVRF